MVSRRSLGGSLSLSGMVWYAKATILIYSVSILHDMQNKLWREEKISFEWPCRRSIFSPWLLKILDMQMGVTVIPCHLMAGCLAVPIYSLTPLRHRNSLSTINSECFISKLVDTTCRNAIKNMNRAFLTPAFLNKGTVITSVVFKPAAWDDSRDTTISYFCFCIKPFPLRQGISSLWCDSFFGLQNVRTPGDFFLSIPNWLFLFFYVKKMVLSDQLFQLNIHI